MGINILDLRQSAVAIKRESTNVFSSGLDQEKEIYDTLAEYKHIPKIYYYGSLLKRRALVMELLGPTLKQLFECVTRLRLSAVLEIGSQLVSILHNC